MRARAAIDLLARHRGDAVAVCALGMAANEWWAATKSEDSFYMHGAMGFAASFALGLALALPQAPVWLINADGSLCMNLGCLLTEASQAAKNLKHFVVDNGVYQTVGGLPVVNDGRTDYAAIARGAGFLRARTIEGLDDLRKQLPAIVAEDGPSFTVLRVEPESGFLRTPPMSRSARRACSSARSATASLGSGPIPTSIRSSSCDRWKESWPPSMRWRAGSTSTLSRFRPPRTIWPMGARSRACRMPSAWAP